MQIVSPEHQPVWSHCPCDEPRDDQWVEWDGRLWFSKAKDITLCEVVGYQIAAHLPLPVQPWLAYLSQRTWREGGINPRICMLIEKWEKHALTAHLLYPARLHPTATANALALSIFDRYEWGDWLLNKDEKEIRFVDLERIGIAVGWPPQRTPFHNYRRSTAAALRLCREAAYLNDIEEPFHSALDLLLDLNIADVVTLDGHPHAASLERIIVKALQSRQSELLWIIREERPPRRTIRVLGKPRHIPRRRRTLIVAYSHGRLGLLEGTIAIKPRPRNKWAVRWDIGTMDNDVALSDRWFSREHYSQALSELLDELERKETAARLSVCTVRWGSVERLSERGARWFGKRIQALWERILTEWMDDPLSKSLI